MVMSVVCHPPTRSVLRCGASQPGQNELEPSARLERPVAEVTMVACGNAEHLDEVANSTQYEDGQVRAGEEYRKASQMQHD